MMWTALTYMDNKCDRCGEYSGKEKLIEVKVDTAPKIEKHGTEHWWLCEDCHIQILEWLRNA